VTVIEVVKVRLNCSASNAFAELSS